MGRNERKIGIIMAVIISACMGIVMALIVRAGADENALSTIAISPLVVKAVGAGKPET